MTNTIEPPRTSAELSSPPGPNTAEPYVAAARTDGHLPGAISAAPEGIPPSVGALLTIRRSPIWGVRKDLWLHTWQWVGRGGGHPQPGDFFEYSIVNKTCGRGCVSPTRQHQGPTTTYARTAPRKLVEAVRSRGPSAATRSSAVPRTVAVQHRRLAVHTSTADAAFGRPRLNRSRREQPVRSACPP
jgi:hypothetical protein